MNKIKEFFSKINIEINELLEDFPEVFGCLFFIVAGFIGALIIFYAFK